MRLRPVVTFPRVLHAAGGRGVRPSLGGCPSVRNCVEAFSYPAGEIRSKLILRYAYAGRATSCWGRALRLAFFLVACTIAA